MCIRYITNTNVGYIKLWMRACLLFSTIVFFFFYFSLFFIYILSSDYYLYMCTSCLPYSVYILFTIECTYVDKYILSGIYMNIIHIGYTDILQKYWHRRHHLVASTVLLLFRFFFLRIGKNTRKKKSTMHEFYNSLNK